MGKEIFEGISLAVIVALIIWMLKRQGSITVGLTRIETKMELITEMREDIKDNTKRITLLEPKTARAHERLDNLKTRGFSS